MSKRKRGRPPKHVMPEKIPAPPEEIARACMAGPPKKNWRYLKRGSDAYADKAPDPREELTGPG